MMTDGAEQSKRRKRRVVWAVLIALLVLLLIWLLSFCSKQEREHTLHPFAGVPTLSLGDAVVTGFSGTIGPVNATLLSDGKAPVDQTFIDTNGPSVRVFDLRHPGFVWNGSYWAPPRRHEIPARAVGQVFGIAIDNSAFPNIYLAATSVYGLNIVTPDADKDFQPERVTRGSTKAVWAPGQMGPGGGAGSIWKVDGKSGQITRFIDIELDGRPTGPAALGALAFDSAHRQLFVSDLSTGMIHRLSLGGKDLGTFDHGVTARPVQGLSRVAYDHRARADITDSDFDSEAPDSWGFAVPERRVWGLAVRDGRLYYSVALGQVSAKDEHGKVATDTGQIWSVGLNKRGDFTRDVRLEITLPEGSADAPVSDIEFTKDGQMIVAQRGIIGMDYAYKPLTSAGVARVYRYWPETPNDPATTSAWYQAPERLSVGFQSGNQTSAGGVALGYGYDSDGNLVFEDCEDAIYLTGDNLRDFRKVEEGFEPEGPLMLNGLQISPSGPARGFNAPPLISYFVNYADAMQSSDESGRVGDVAVYRLDCKEASCVAGAGGSVSTLKRESGIAVLPPPPPPPGNPPCVGIGCVPVVPPCVGVDCVPVDPPCVGVGCDPVDPPCVGIDCDPECVGPDCPPDEPEQCMKVEGEAVCDPQAGGWAYKLFTTDYAGIGLDTMTAQSTTTGVSVSNGPNITMVPPPGVVTLSGTTPGQTVTIDVCGYNASAKATGEPYDCCRDTLTIQVPNGVCEPADDDGGPL
tara:strand:- start:10919 stop:13153 length:2235 start_codon:yes stop_codon:yes gene_type:complete